MYRNAKEIGDPEFPLEIDLDAGVTYEHELIGRKVEVSPYAKGKLGQFHGKSAVVQGVILKNGQLAGLKVEVADCVCFGPIKNFFLERAYAEDIHQIGPKSLQIREALIRWEKPRNYYKSSWEGIELQCFYLSKTVQNLAIEVGAPVRYPSSKRDQFDAKSWRFVIPQDNETSVVSCHTTMHDHVWDITTSVYSTRDVDTSRLQLIGHEDHWQRIYRWMTALALNFQNIGFNYGPTIRDLVWRSKMSTQLTRLCHSILPEIVAGYEKMTGQTTEPPAISVGIGSARVEPCHVGLYEKPTDVAPYAIMTMRKRAFEKGPEYVKYVLMHELIHHVLANAGVEAIHGKEFQELSAISGLPKQYRKG